MNVIQVPDNEAVKALAAQTKADLAAMILQLQAENADLREQLQERSAVASASGEPGWLFTTPNPAYSGVMYGVRFTNGRGFLPKGRKDAERIMRQIVSDFGYEVTEISAAEFQTLPERKVSDNAGRAFLEKVAPAQVRT